MPKSEIKTRKRYRIGVFLMKFAVFLSKTAALIAIPFALLIRGAVFTHERIAVFPWVAILGGILLTSALLFVYALLLSRLISRKPKVGKGILWRFVAVFCAVAAYSIHGVFALSESHLKDDSLRREYRRLHPILRLATGTIVFLDEGFVVTDASRTSGDYKKMKLQTNKNSLHYVQKGGYVHAIDVRTNDRFFARNFLIKLYFKSMGFNTLRHTGTADHLHVSLFSHGNPGKI